MKKLEDWARSSCRGPAGGDKRTRTHCWDFGENGSKREGGTKKFSTVCKKAKEEAVIGGEGKGQRALGKRRLRNFQVYIILREAVWGKRGKYQESYQFGVLKRNAQFH